MCTADAMHPECTGSSCSRLSTQGASAQGSQAELQLHRQARVTTHHTIQSSQQSECCTPETSLQACMLHKTPDAAVGTAAQTGQVVQVQQ